MPFYFYHKERLRKQVAQLAVLRYREMVDIGEFDVYEDDGKNGVMQPPSAQKSGVLKLGDYWRGVDRYLWLCAEIRLNPDWADKDVVGVFDFGRTDPGSNGFESLLYVDGEPYQAVDSNHREVFLDNRKAGSSVRLQFRAWSGLDEGQMVEVEHKIKQAQIGWLDKDTDGLYYMARNVLDTVEELHEDNPDQTWLVNLLVKAFDRIDFSYPGSAEFYASVTEANALLNQELQGQRQMPVEVSVIGHTHIDTAWLWQFRHTREKCARSFSTVNRLMERYEEYQFLQTQAQLYDYVKRDYPALYDRIKQRVAEGRWEPSGSMWVECDCNLTSGESIVRQILYGTRFFEREFGYKNDFLWLPDVFGYSWALPQILKKSGIDTFVTTKISWNDTNKMPYDTFLWRGMDGSEVVTHFITAPEHSENRYYTYNGIIDPYMIHGVWSQYANKDLNTNVLLAYGYGDGGGGANRDMLENMRCLKKMPGLPSIRCEHATDYLRRLNQTVRENKRNGYVPIWDGELYLEFHRGTYTSQAYNKRKNRQLEFLARNTEMAAVLAMMHADCAYPQEPIYEAWKIIMRHQFHDVIPGSSIHEVYQDSHAEYAEAENLLTQVWQDSMAALTKEQENVYTVVNTLNWERDAVAYLPTRDDKVCFRNAVGERLSSAVTENGIAVLIPNMKPLEMETIVACPDLSGGTDAVCGEASCRAETVHYRVAWNAAGQLISIYDKAYDREVLDQTRPANVLEVFEDKPRQFDAWELESTFENKMEPVERLMQTKVEENALGIFVTFVWIYRNSEIRQIMKLYHHSRRIDFDTKVFCKEREKLLKVAFPLAIRATHARYDIQFGNIERPITRNTSWEAAKFEVVAHKWADMTETGYGVALMNNCKYGYDLKNNVMRLTLLKSANFPDATADYGEHCFTYALYPHADEWYHGVEQEASNLNNPPLVAVGRSIGEAFCFAKVDNPNVAIDAFKKAEDSECLLVRLHEFAGTRGKVCLELAKHPAKWRCCDLMERALEDWREGEICLDIHPYEILTLQIAFA